MLSAEDKKQYNREHYRKNAEKAKERVRLNRLKKKTRRTNEEVTTDYSDM